MPRSYVYMGNGHAIAVEQSSDGLWEMKMGMNDESATMLSDLIGAKVTDGTLAQQIADTMAANNPPAPASDESTLLAAGVRAGVTSSADQNTPIGVTGVLLFLNVTATPGGLRTLKLDVEAKDPASAVYSSIVSTGLIGTTITSVGNYLLFACPFIGGLLSGLFGSVVQLPRTWRCKVTPSDGSNWTYSVARSYLR